MIRTATLLFLILTLTGCCTGFCFRGQEKYVLGSLNTLYLQVDNPYSPIAKDLTRILNHSNVVLTKCRKEAPYTLEIMNENTEIFTGGFGFSNQVSLSTVKYHVTYQILNRAGYTVMRPRTITVQQSFTININQALSGNLIPPSFINEMRRNVIYQLMDQLSSCQTQSALK